MITLTKVYSSNGEREQCKEVETHRAPHETPPGGASHRVHLSGTLAQHPLVHIRRDILRHANTPRQWFRSSVAGMVNRLKILYSRSELTRLFP